MPFRDRNLQLLRSWEPDANFDPVTDRLLLTTSEDEVIVAYWHRSHDSATGHLAVDLDYASKSFLEIPMELKMHHDFQTQEDWCVFLYDGALTSDGPQLDVVAIGQGWKWEMHTRLCLKMIQPVTIEDLASVEVPEYLDGIYIQPHRISIMNRDSDRRNDPVQA